MGPFSGWSYAGSGFTDQRITAVPSGLGINESMAPAKQSPEPNPRQAGAYSPHVSAKPSQSPIRGAGLRFPAGLGEAGSGGLAPAVLARSQYPARHWGI